MPLMKKLLIFFALLSLLFADIFPFETIQKANRAYQNGAYLQSARLFGQLDSNQTIQAFNMGNAYYKAKQYTKAIDAYNHAKGVDEVMRLYNLGNCYFKQGNLDQAIAHYTQALALRQDPDVAYNLELAKRQKERQKKQKPKQKEPKKRKKNTKPKKPPTPPKKPTAPQKPRSDQNKSPNRKLSPQEQLSQKELKQLMKKLRQQKMPTMIYQITPYKGAPTNENPW